MIRNLSRVPLKMFKRSYTLSVGNIKEQILTKNKAGMAAVDDILKSETMAVIGYGPQGQGQSLNLRDNGYNVVIGVRDGKSKDQALKDGWIEGDNLLSIEEAADKGTIIQYLLSDASQIQLWDTIKKYLTPNKTLYFSHGFGITFSKQTNIIPPKDIDVILVAPKGPGSMLRKKFVEGTGINSSYAVHQNYTGKALDKSLALAFGIGSENLFKTTFDKEVYSDLTGERCTLMGLIQGAFKAQYDVLRENGHSPSEAYNETVEEALVSLYPLINEKGMDWMFANCSTTAQRGALDWSKVFYTTLKPIIEKCYQNVTNGIESQVSIDSNSSPDYRSTLNKELEEIYNQEIWNVGRQLRELK
jgi:ketol-acid reductoisomerase